MATIAAVQKGASSGQEETDEIKLIVELKWDKPVNAALAQIKDRNYPQELASFGGQILLVGITYRVRGRKHICQIEDLEK